MDKGYMLDFKIWSFNGYEVYRKDDPERKSPITTEDGLKEGDEVWWFALWAYQLGKVVKHESQLSIKDENLHGLLEFAKDSRKCWVVTAITNLKALQKVALHCAGIEKVKSVGTPVEREGSVYTPPQE